MDSLALLALITNTINKMWYAVPLIIAVSLVYSATRHEEMAPIFTHAVRIGIWIVGFMAVIFVILFLVDMVVVRA